MTGLPIPRPWPLLCIAFLLAAGCSRPWAADLPPNQRAALQAWLFCDECDRAERDSAVVVGASAVAPLGDVLARIPSGWLENLEDRYGEAAARAGLTGASAVRYVSLHLENFKAQAQSRSAVALGDLGKAGSAAAIQELRDAINAAQARGYRADVVRALELALLTATTPALGGTVTPSRVAFLDTAWVTQAGGVPWDGDEVVRLVGAPFPDDVGIGFRGAGRDSLGFLGAAMVGEYGLSILNVGSSQDTQYAPFRVTSFPAPRTLVIRDVTAQSLPLTVLRSLSRAISPPDTVHYFRFRPTADLPVTARVDWTGPSLIDLVWDDCVNQEVAGLNPGAITGTIVDAAGAPLEAAIVRLVGTALAASTDVQGTFSLAVPAGWSGTLRATRIGYQAVNRSVREGMGEIWIILRSAGSGPGTSVGPTVTSSSSPNSSSLTIPGHACRLLGLIMRDSAPTSSLVRLRVTSP